MKPLLPQFSSLLPTATAKRAHLERNSLYTPEKFESYTDWFYFIHIDPVLRWWHSLGMVIGTAYFLLLGLSLFDTGFTWNAGRLYLTAVFFFYVLPLLSHVAYDGGSAKSSPEKFHATLLPVIHINLLTVTGRYDRWLRRFVQKYPFTREAWRLEERELRSLFKAPDV